MFYVFDEGGGRGGPELLLQENTNFFTLDWLQASADRKTRGPDETRAEEEYWHPEEDPLMKGINMNDPASLKNFMAQSYTRSKETLEEMKTSRPFTYHQHSVNHGILHNSEVGTPRWVILGVLAAVGVLILSEFAFADQYDKHFENHWFN